MPAARPKPSSLPLSALLSHVFVAFTIECDNEVEHRMPHRTSTGDACGNKGPWLTSIVMWWNCMRFVDKGGIQAKQLVKRARTKTNFHGMARWGYITVDGDSMVHPTPYGSAAKEFWSLMPAEIEGRWMKRYGKTRIENLRKSLRAVVKQFHYELPDCLPILGYGLSCLGRVIIDRLDDNPKAEDQKAKVPQELYPLLSRLLLAYALEFEREFKLSLAISANVLRVIEETDTEIKNLPSLTGVSKEAIRMAINFLEKQNEPNQSYLQRAQTIEERWRKRYGDDTITRLRHDVESLPDFEMPEPYPEGWRAKRPKPNTLPHFPMILHRGGYPDGS